jgi:hypothetical protein
VRKRIRRVAALHHILQTHLHRAQGLRWL